MIEKDYLGNWSPESLTLTMASAQVVGMSLANNSPSQDSNLFQSRYVTPGFKPFSYLIQRIDNPEYSVTDLQVLEVSLHLLILHPPAKQTCTAV